MIEADERLVKNQLEWAPIKVKITLLGKYSKEIEVLPSATYQEVIERAKRQFPKCFGNLPEGIKVVAASPGEDQPIIDLAIPLLVRPHVVLLIL